MSAGLKAIAIADPPRPWRELGFAVDEVGRFAVGAVTVALGAEGRGLVSWSVDGVAGEIDGLASADLSGEAPSAPASHPNGTVGIDHIVVATPDFERTADALQGAGLPLKRVRDAGGFRQGFRRLGPAILELVELRDAPDGPARFWGLVFVVPDLLSVSEHLGDPHPAVQPGRQIAAVKRSAGLGTHVAFMTPEHD